MTTEVLGIVLLTLGFGTRVIALPMMFVMVVAIFTTRPLRYARLSQRPDRPLSAEEAEQRDFAEIENVEKAGPIAIADYTIVNDGTEEDLLLAVDKLLSDHILSQ